MPHRNITYMQKGPVFGRPGFLYRAERGCFRGMADRHVPGPLFQRITFSSNRIVILIHIFCYHPRRQALRNFCFGVGYGRGSQVEQHEGAQDHPGRDHLAAVQTFPEEEKAGHADDQNHAHTVGRVDQEGGQLGKGCQKKA